VGWSRETVPWSHRAHYNLACYESVRARHHPFRIRSLTELREGAGGKPPQEEDNVRVASWALEEALRLAPDRQRLQLMRWANRDPALHTLRTDDDTEASYKTLCRRYEVQPTASPRRRPVWA
jgi:hypothetical protein